jgi:lactoylglutathione lyase
MTYKFNHVHLKATDPEKSANWYVTAFNFEILSSTLRQSGSRFVRCRTADGIIVNISGAGIGEQMGDGSASVHWGLEHFGIEVDDIDTQIKRLEDLGAKLLEGPNDSPTGLRIAFIQGPDDVSIELMQLHKRES